MGTALDPWTYDAAGRTLSVPGLITDATYNARHQTTSIDYANGISTSFAYDNARGWVTAIDNQDAQQVSVYAKGYTRNARGQITATTSSRAAQEWVYTYDNLDRLTGADNLGDNSMDQTFTWSISGNLTCNSALGAYTYPAPTAARPHAPTGVGALSFAYDAAGNMTTGLEGRTIAYDGANRPVQVAWRSATTDYLYGPDGERVKKLTAAGTTTWLGDTELTPQGRTIVHPHPDVRLVDGIPSFLHRDHLASVTVITDDAGATITTRDYTPHGDMEGHEWVDPLSQPESKAWIGERFDPETGLVYLHARYYDPKLGLFTQGDWWDPTEPGVGTNRYMYSFGDPVNLSDRNGHVLDPVSRGLIGGAVGGLVGLVANVVDQLRDEEKDFSFSEAAQATGIGAAVGGATAVAGPAAGARVASALGVTGLRAFGVSLTTEASVSSIAAGAGQVTNNAINGDPLGQGVPEAMAGGAIGSLAGAGVPGGSAAGSGLRGGFAAGGRAIGADLVGGVASEATTRGLRGLPSESEQDDEGTPGVSSAIEPESDHGAERDGPEGVP